MGRILFLHKHTANETFNVLTRITTEQYARSTFYTPEDVTIVCFVFCFCFVLFCIVFLFFCCCCKFRLFAENVKVRKFDTVRLKHWSLLVILHCNIIKVILKLNMFTSVETILLLCYKKITYS